MLVRQLVCVTPLIAAITIISLVPRAPVLLQCPAVLSRAVFTLQTSGAAIVFSLPTCNYTRLNSEMF